MIMNIHIYIYTEIFINQDDFIHKSQESPAEAPSPGLPWPSPAGTSA